jgi:hypothetical protein
MELKWDLSGADEKTAPEYVADFLNGKRMRGVIRHVYGPFVPTSEEQGATFAEFRQSLKGLVDQWIDSGRVDYQTCGESPHDRKLSWTVKETLRLFWERNSLRAEYGRDGRLTVRVDPRRGGFMRLQDGLSRAADYGITWFARLLESKSPERLFRCDGDKCGIYFVRVNAPRKGVAIKHGVFCQKCTNKGGARRTFDARDNLQKRMIGAAADWWPEWKPTRRNGKRSVWVVEKVNEQCGTNKKGKWVTQHQSEIEEEVLRREHAKS